MKRIRFRGLVAAFACAASAIVPDPASAQLPVPAPSQYAPSPSVPPWPAQFTQDGREFELYPPELDRWQGDRLDGRAAVSVQPVGADAPVFGALYWSARTREGAAGADVVVSEITITRATFPTEPERVPDYSTALQQHFSGATWAISRERLVSALAIDRAIERTHNQPVRNEPPHVVYSDVPAILVPIDGSPVMREMVGLDLARVVNTRALLLRDKSSARYFLFVAGRWLDASTLDGPWADAQVRPMALDEAKDQAVAAGQVDLLDDDQAPLGAAPAVFVRTTPTELVQTEGAPQYAPIEHTQLLYVVNSPNRLFLDLQTQQHYVLLNGRWFRARALRQANWEFVAGGQLPADFAQIPAEHPTEAVRAAVPGTPQAQEAAIANSAPQMATVKRNAAGLELTYDGPPQFRPIEGTSLEYAVNAPMPVIRVDWRNYYALDNGVWFVAGSADGPWSVATDVPAVIYTIPRSSPLHYVTYVRVYDATPEDVYVGYTPGYVGSYVSPDNTVVYGTGWVYQPWVGSVWYGAPITWGFGFTAWRTWWNPWRPWWASRPIHCFRPWWGPWRAPAPVHRVAATHTPSIVTGGVVVPTRRVVVAGTGTTTNVADIYRRWGPRVVTRGDVRPVAVAPPARIRPATGGGAIPPAPGAHRQDRPGQRPSQGGRGDDGVGAPRWTTPPSARTPPISSPRSSQAPNAPRPVQPPTAQGQAAHAPEGSSSGAQRPGTARAGPQSSGSPLSAPRPMAAPLGPSLVPKAMPLAPRGSDRMREPAVLRGHEARPVFRAPAESRAPPVTIAPPPAAREAPGPVAAPASMRAPESAQSGRGLGEQGSARGSRPSAGTGAAR